MRVKERMQSRRQELVEEMIKRDPLYRPPADYRCTTGFRAQGLASG
jgi:Splicing factor 1 helix-hairpin domain